MEYKSPIAFICLLIKFGILNAADPEFNVDLVTKSNLDNLTEIRISDRLVFELTITVPIGSYNLTSSIYGTDDIFTICDVEVINVGLNFIDTQPSDITPIFTSEDETSGNVQPYANNNVTFYFGNVENSGAEPNVTNCSQIVVVFEVIVVNSSNFNQGSIFSIYANTSLDNAVVVGQQNFTAIEKNLYSITPPIAYITSPEPVLVGGVTNWTVTLDLQDAVNKLQVNAWINGTYEYPACDIFVVEIGPAFGCFDKRSAIVSYTSTTTSMKIPTLINTEFNKNLTVANGTDISLVVLVRVPSYVGTSDVLWANLEVYLDDKLAIPVSEQIMLDHGGSLPSPTGTPTVDVSTLANASTIAIGSGIVFSIDVGTFPGDVAVYDITIATDAGVVKVCDVQLMDIGSNVCMDSNISVTYTSSGSNNFYDGATVMIGSVPNIQPLADPADPKNKFRVEVAVCLADDTAAQIGDTLTMNVDAFYDINVPSKKVTGSKTYDVTNNPDPSLATDKFSLSNSNNIPAYIGEVVSVNFNATFDGTTDRFTFNVSVPVSGGTALAFIESVTIQAIGSELLCMDNRTMSQLDNSTVSYSQTYSVTMDSGPITYTDMKERNPFLNYTTNGTYVNQVMYTVSLVVADHVVNTAGSSIPVTAILEGATGFSTNSTAFIDVQISGIETPVLDFNFWMEQFSYTEKISGDNVTCSVELRLNDTSTAHAQDVVVHVMTPHYIEFGQMLDVEGANVSVVPQTLAPGIDLMVGEIDFKDHILFSFTLILDPARVMPIGAENLRTVVPVDMTYKGEIRGDRVDVGDLYSGYIVKEFGFNTESPTTLGIESGTVLDCQMQGSSYLSTNPPFDARLNVGGGWKPLRRGSPFCGHEYLQVNLGSLSFITGLLVQSTTNDANDLISSFQLQYSDDTMVWYDVTDVDMVTPKDFQVTVTGGASINTVYEINLNETQRFTALFVRLISGVCLSGIRLDLKGVKQSGSPVDCSLITAPVSSVPEQSYVINDVTGTMFVCGLTQVGEPVQCSRSDDGETWQVLDASIAHIVAVISNTSLVIAETDYISTYLVSEDDGYTWHAITDEILTEYQSIPGYTASTSLPYNDYSGINNNNMYNTYGMDGPNGLKFTGVMKGIAVHTGVWDIAAWWGTEDWKAM